MSGSKSIFTDKIWNYLEYIQGTVTVSTFRITRGVLLSFDALLIAEGRDSIDEKIINQWIENLRERDASQTVSNKVSSLRKFLRHLRYLGYPVFIPECPKVSSSYAPYIFSDEEIQMIFLYADHQAEQHASDRTRRMDMEFCMLLRMLLGCGFRLGEPLAVKVKDISFERGTILIRHAKNSKQRVVAMDRTLAAMLEKYCIAMGIRSSPESYLFPSGTKDGCPVSRSTCDNRFRKLLKETGIFVPPKEHTRGQCLHCFRHYFAVHSFARAEKNGRPLNDSVPFLSVYLGHHDMDETEKYLKFSSDMFPEYTDLFEDYAVGVFTEVEDEKE